MYIRELHNSGVRGPKYGVFKDARYEDDNIIISDSTLRSLLHVAVRTGTGGDKHRMLVRVGKQRRGATKYAGTKYIGVSRSPPD